MKFAVGIPMHYAAIIWYCTVQIIFNGQYFRNRLNSDYATRQPIVLACWFFIYTTVFVCSVCGNQIPKKKEHLFYFGVQFLAFAIYSISVFCFSAYILATVGSVISVIFSICLIVSLFRNTQYFTMSLIVVTLFLYLHCVFCGIVIAQRNMGFGKNK